MPHTNYGRLTARDREDISRGLEQGKSYRVLAQELGRSVSTVSREVSANGGQTRYCADCAQRQAQKKAAARKRGRCKITQNKRLQRYIHSKLQCYWSPEQIAASLKALYPQDSAMHVSHESIYHYLYVFTKGELKKRLTKQLRRKHAYRRKRGRKRVNHTVGRIPAMVSIDERPQEAHNRVVPGHWEGDIMIGKYHQSALGTLVERTTRFALLVPLASYDAEMVRKAFAQVFQTIPGHLKQSLTYDQGKEMAEHLQFTKDTKIKVYFAHPQSPWERGTNENTNGLIRQFFPKGTDFNQISLADIKQAQDLLNGRPRKTLDWQTPTEVLKKVLR